MAMLDAFFNRGFRGAKCKTLLKLTVPRIKLLRNRKELQLKQMRKDIAKLLETGQEATAHIRVEHIIREQKIMDAHEIIELLCELIVVRLPIIETQRECPLDLKEAISTLCFAAPRCSDLPELLQVQMLFGAKYGKEFVTAAMELMPDSGVNRQIIELLSVRAPPVDERLKLLKEIAEEHELDWDPTATEAEFMKPHEDLLNGPNQFTDGSQLPLPKEKHESLYSASVGKPSNEKSNPETDVDFLDLPAVPQGPLHPNFGTGTFPIVSAPSAPSEDSTATQPDHISVRTMAQDPNKGVSVPPDFETVASSVKRRDEIPLHSDSEGTISAPHCAAPKSSASVNVLTFYPSEGEAGSQFGVTPNSPLDRRDQIWLHPDEKNSDPALCGATESSRKDTSLHSHEKDLVSMSHEAMNTPVAQEEKHANPEMTSGLNAGHIGSSISKTRTDVAIDLQDVLAAAQQAAETAEQAAAAARAAATLAQAKIAELYKRKDDPLTDKGNNSVIEEKQFHNTMSVGSEKHVDSNEHSYSSGPPTEMQRQLSDAFVYPMQRQLSDAFVYPSYDAPAERDPSSPDDQHVGYLWSHQPQRSNSIEDDPFSYPNLFSSQYSFSVRDDHSPTHK